jgi:hypothetical protein
MFCRQSILSLLKHPFSSERSIDRCPTRLDRYPSISFPIDVSEAYPIARLDRYPSIFPSISARLDRKTSISSSTSTRLDSYPSVPRLSIVLDRYQWNAFGSLSIRILSYRCLVPDPWNAFGTVSNFRSSMFAFRTPSLITFSIIIIIG